MVWDATQCIILSNPLCLLLHWGCRPNFLWDQEVRYQWSCLCHRTCKVVLYDQGEVCERLSYIFINHLKSFNLEQPPCFSWCVEYTAHWDILRDLGLPSLEIRRWRWIVAFHFLISCFGTESSALLWGVQSKDEVQLSHIEMEQFWLGIRKKELAIRMIKLWPDVCGGCKIWPWRFRNVTGQDWTTCSNFEISTALTGNWRTWPLGVLFSLNYSDSVRRFPAEKKSIVKVMLNSILNYILRVKELFVCGIRRALCIVLMAKII